MTKLELPTLYKALDGGKTGIWQISVEGTEAAATIVTRFGQEGGTIREEREAITKGKNVGRKNETTPLAQAVAEARAKHAKHLERKGYGLDRAASAQVRGVSPMLAHHFKDHMSKINWATAFAQPKLDGFRMLASYNQGQIVLRSREGKPVTTMAHLLPALEAVFRKQPDLILDGELWSAAFGRDFPALASAIKKKRDKTEHINYNVYDQISKLGFKQRYEQLRSLGLPSQGGIYLVETVIVDDADTFATCQQHFEQDGYEGAILRHGTVGYEAGKRSAYLLKSKEWQDDWFPIVDVKEGRGTHVGMAIFQCQTTQGTEFDVLAPGTHEEKKKIWDEWTTYVGRRVHVKYFEMSRGDEPAPRFPVALEVSDERPR